MRTPHILNFERSEVSEVIEWRPAPNKWLGVVDTPFCMFQNGEVGFCTLYQWWHKDLPLVCNTAEEYEAARKIAKDNGLPHESGFWLGSKTFLTKTKGKLLAGFAHYGYYAAYYDERDGQYIITLYDGDDGYMSRSFNNEKNMLTFWGLLDSYAPFSSEVFKTLGFGGG